MPWVEAASTRFLSVYEDGEAQQIPSKTELNL